MKKLKRILLFFLLGSFLISCQEDSLKEEIGESSEGSHNHFEKSVNSLSYDDLKSKKDLMSIISQIEDANQMQGKGVYSESFKMEIDTSQIYELRNGWRKSYSFRILEDSLESSDITRNLVLDYTGYEGTYYAYIFEYTLDEKKKKDLYEGITDDSSIVSNIYTYGPDYETQSILGGDDDCYEIKIWPGEKCKRTDGGPPHSWGEKCMLSGDDAPQPPLIEVLKVPCGGGSGGDPSAAPWQGVSFSGMVGGEGNNNPSTYPGSEENPGESGIIDDISESLNGLETIPVLKPIDPPCEQLNQLTDESNFNSKINELENNLTGNKEKAFLIFDENGNNDFSNTYLGNETGGIELPFETLPEPDLFNSYAAAHNHLNKNFAFINRHIGIFTPEDLGPLFVLGSLEIHPQNPNNNPKSPVIFVVTDLGLFALKIKNLSKLTAALNWYGNKSLKERQLYINNVFSNKNAYNITPYSNREESIIGFLRFIEDQDIGIELYEFRKAEDNPNSNSDNWNLLSPLNLGYGQNPFDFIELPC